MTFLQILANIFACTNIYLLANGWVKLGCAIGLPGQVLWMWLFWVNGVPWLIFTDAIIAIIYINKLWHLRHTPFRKPKFRSFQL